MPEGRRGPPASLTRLASRINLRDVSLVPLLVSNALAIWWTVHNHLSLQTVMMIYWSQSVAIGAVNVLRILALRDYSTDNLSPGGRLSPPAGTKLRAAGFFMLHYGFFHVVYLVFILAAMTRGHPGVNMQFVLYGAGLFAGTDLFALVLRWNEETHGRKLGQVVLAPYLRIVPMHLAIILGGFVNYHPGLTLGLFQGLKTLADVLAHLVHNRRPTRS